MDVGVLGAIGIASSFGISALGAAIGMGVNGPAVIGSWKKCYVQKRPAPFILLIFAATCLSNVIYGFIIMDSLAGSVILNDNMLFALGLSSGLCIGAVAVTQAKCAAYAAEAMAETGQGFGNFLMVVGIAETISLFAMVFTILFA